MRGADDRWRQDQGQGSGRDTIRPALPAAGQGHAGPARAAKRRHVCPGPGRDAAEVEQETARPAGRIRSPVVDRNAPRIRGFSRQSQRVPRRPGRPERIALSAPYGVCPANALKAARCCRVDVMSLPALQKFEQKIERQLRFLEFRKIIFERKIERHIRLFEQNRGGIGKKIEQQIKQFELKKGIRLDDEVRFIRSWIERPLSTGAVAPSGKILARTMARYVDPNSSGPVVELGPGTGPVTEALVAAGVDPSRLVLVEFNPTFFRLLRTRYPEATLVQGDAYSMRRLLESLLLEPAAAVVSGLPLMTKPIKMRLRLLRDAFDLMLPGAPFVQFTYSVASPVPTRLKGFTAEPSERIWMNLPPARVWVYRKT